MKEHPFLKLSAKIRPELNELEGNPFFQAFSEVGQLVFHLPISLITVVWLFRIWDPGTLQENLLLIILLTIGMVITNNRTAIILIEIEPQKNVMATSSLGVIFLWTGLFILGPVFMWVNLAADTISAVIDARRLARLGQNAFWGPFANYTQGLLHILGALLGLSVYTAVGGQFPLTALEPVNWYPAILAIVISAIFSGTIVLPGFSYLSKVMGIPISLKANSHIILTVAISVLAQAPFAIPIVLVYVYAGWTTFIFLLIGLILVNLLAYHLSESNQRSLRQSREMEQLEQLGEEIIRAAPDEIDLAEILANHMRLMFSNAQDIFEIRLLENAGIDLHIEQTTHKKMLPAEKLWDELWQSEEKYIILKDQKTPLNENVYGDAIMVKIISAASNANDGPPTCIGGIYLLRQKSFARTTDSLATVEALESQIASALYRTQAYAETIASEKMSRELAIAGEIQASFLPDTVPDLDGWQITASLTPARQTSGDFYDFIEFDDGRLGFLVADVADKGTGAALYMALSRTLIRTFALQYPEQPEEALRLANERILEDARSDQFVTVFYGILNPSTGSLTYANAGHNPPYLFHKSDEPLALIRTGMALGVMEGMNWEQKTAQLEHDDLLIAYSDGITDAQNLANDLYADVRLIAITQKHKTAASEEIHANILDDITTFVGEADQFDDMSLMVIKRK